MYLENRLIAMLDVLGFSNQIQGSTELQATTEKYAKLIAQAKGHMFTPKPLAGSPNPPLPNFEFGQFVFDTLVLVSYPIDIKSAYRFIFATILLMEIFFAQRFPLRGSIGLGDFCSNDDAQIFLSNAFKKLLSDGERQQWSGCALLPEVDSTVLPYLMVNDSPYWKSSALHQYHVPFKGQEAGERRWCLNWSHLLPPDVVEAGLLYMAGDSSKQTNTTKYLAAFTKLHDDSQLLPADFSPAKIVRFLKARSGIRVKFEDQSGIAVNPGCGYTLAAYDGAHVVITPEKKE